MTDPMGEFGRYLGPLLFEALDDGRLMRVTALFEFEDAQSKRWLVPPNVKVDGASIPRALWSLVGGPFEGKYRKASVIHDYYCDVRTEPWRAVHRVFYNGMRASGVSESRAKLMYAGVYFAGPRWSDVAVDNARLTRGGLHPSPKFSSGVSDAVRLQEATFQAPPGEGGGSWTPATADLDLGKLERLVGSENPSLDEIDSVLDTALSPVAPQSPLRSIQLRVESESESDQ